MKGIVSMNNIASVAVVVTEEKLYATGEMILWDDFIFFMWYDNLFKGSHLYPFSIKFLMFSPTALWIRQDS
mgnify:CR=1 FL=1